MPSPAQLCCCLLLIGSNKCLTMPNAQFEILFQFFVGMYNHEQEYIDDWLLVASTYFWSIFGFWFDCVTSIPWSFMDLHFYMVQKC